jgi:hypothetical protein
MGSKFSALSRAETVLFAASTMSRALGRRSGSPPTCGLAGMNPVQFSFVKIALPTGLDHNPLQASVVQLAQYHTEFEDCRRSRVV